MHRSIKYSKRHGTRGHRPEVIIAVSHTTYTGEGAGGGNKNLKRTVHSNLSHYFTGTGIPPLSASVIKPTFVTKDGPRRIKLKSSSQGSPVPTSNTSDCEKVMGEGEDMTGT